jgi:hypothetical protein
MAPLGRPVPLLELRDRTLCGPSRNNPVSIEAQAPGPSRESIQCLESVLRASVPYRPSSIPQLVSRPT